MTICIGWKDANAVYLAADSAVTSSRSLTAARTSFGELHYADGSRSVEESALKIFRHGSTAATFCGSAEVAREIFATYSSIPNTLHALEAFTSAWKSNGPFSKENSVSALFAFWDDSPQLYLFSSNGEDEGESINLLAIGNLANESRNNILSVVELIPHNLTDPQSRLQCALSYLQSHSVFGNYLEYGIAVTTLERL